MYAPIYVQSCSEIMLPIYSGPSSQAAVLCDVQEANGGGGGLIAYATTDGGSSNGDGGKRQVIAFEGTDVKGRTGRLNKGDPVQFFITTDVRTGKRRATQVDHFSGFDI